MFLYICKKVTKMNENEVKNCNNYYKLNEVIRILKDRDVYHFIDFF